MADMRKNEEGNAAAKLRLDLPISIDENFDQTVEAKEVEFESSKRKKLETSLEDEPIIGCSFLMRGKMVETEDDGQAFEEAESESIDKHNLEISLELETNIGCSSLVSGKIVVAEDVTEASNVDEVDEKDEHLEVEDDVQIGRYTAAEKGKGLLVEESDEESDYYTGGIIEFNEFDIDDDDGNCCGDCYCEFSDEFDSGLEDIPV